MTITISTETLRSIEWSHYDSETVHSDIRPAKRESEDLGDGFPPLEYEVEPAVSQVYGFTFLRGEAPDGLVLELGINWGASGKTDGTFADLYAFTVAMEDHGPDGLVDLRRVGSDGQTYEDVRILEALDEDDEDRRVALDILEGVARDIDWEEYAREVLPQAPEPEAVDTETDDDDMEVITLERDDARDIRFTGKLVAQTSSREHSGPRSNRWTVLRLYKTKGGKWVAHQIGRTQWQGEQDRYSVVMADTDEELVERLGSGWLAKDLYWLAGIDAAEDIE